MQKMKTIVGLVLTATLTTFVAAAAQAGEADGVYVGVGVGSSKISSSGLSKSTDTTITGLLGYRISDYLAAEISYTKMGSVVFANKVSSALDSAAVYAVGSYPVLENDGHVTSVIAKLGFGGNGTSASGSAGSSTYNTSAVYGLGVQYQYYKQLGFRGLMDSTKFGSTPNSVSGANYSLTALYGF